MEIFKGLLTKNIDESNILFLGLTNFNNTLDKENKLASNIIKELSKKIDPITMNGFILNHINLYDLDNIIFTSLDEVKIMLNEKIYKYKDKFKIIINNDLDLNSISILKKTFLDNIINDNYIPVLINIDANLNLFINEYYLKNNEYIDLNNKFKEENIIFLGTRSFFIKEVNYLKNHKLIDVFKSNDLIKLGLDSLIKYLKLKYNKSNYKFFINYNLNVIDSNEFKSVYNSVPFGLSNKFILDLLNSLIKEFNVDTLNISNLNFYKDNDNKDALTLLKELYEIFYILETKNILN